MLKNLAGNVLLVISAVVLARLAVLVFVILAVHAVLVNFSDLDTTLALVLVGHVVMTRLDLTPLLQLVVVELCRKVVLMRHRNVALTVYATLQLLRFVLLLNMTNTLYKNSSNNQPHNYYEMQQARIVQNAILQNIEFMPDTFDMYPFIDASYVSLCTGCTDPRAYNYDSAAEVDDNSCL